MLESLDLEFRVVDVKEITLRLAIMSILLSDASCGHRFVLGICNPS